MVDVVTSVDIVAPLEKVASYAMDPDRAPEWYANIRSSEWRSARPLAVGSRIAFVAHFLGRKLSYVYEIKELSGSKLVMGTADGPFPMETTYSFAAIGPDRTRMTLRNRGKPAGFPALIAPFMSMMMRRANKKDLARIKSILESSG